MMRQENSLVGLLSKGVAAVGVALLCACSPAPSDTSHSVSFTVSLDDGSTAVGGLSWMCQYSHGFSERDMAKYVNAKSVPAEVPINYVEFADGRMAILRPSQWPPQSAQGLCTEPQAHGWQGYLLEPGKHVTSLAWFHDGITHSEKRPLSISNLRADAPVPSSPKDNEAKAKRLLSESSTITAYYFELPLYDEVQSNQLSPGVVSALKALPKDRPTVLRVANPAKVAHKARSVEGLTQFVELPDFQLAHSHPISEIALQLKAPGVPIPVPKNVYNTDNATVSMLGIKSPPLVLFPQVKEAVALLPLAAVWYPATKLLVVVNWEDNSDEVLGRLK